MTSPKAVSLLVFIWSAVEVNQFCYDETLRSFLQKRGSALQYEDVAVDVLVYVMTNI